jgi:hypothetical protein
MLIQRWVAAISGWAKAASNRIHPAANEPITRRRSVRSVVLRCMTTTIRPRPTIAVAACQVKKYDPGRP